MSPANKKRLKCGIPCSLRAPDSRRIVERVLEQIRNRHPVDFARLCERVREIRPLPQDKFEDGTLGEWLGKTIGQVNWNSNFFDLPLDTRLNWDECAEGIAELPEVGQVEEGELAAIAAEEFGHACTRQIDRERRKAPRDEWGGEAAADWYVYRWGFGRLKARYRKTRSLAHHGAAPGGTIMIDFEAHTETYRMTRSFVYHTVSTEAFGDCRPRHQGAESLPLSNQCANSPRAQEDKRHIPPPIALAWFGWKPAGPTSWRARNGHRN
jgi:hypothetical protein